MCVSTDPAAVLWADPQQVSDHLHAGILLVPGSAGSCTWHPHFLQVIMDKTKNESQMIQRVKTHFAFISSTPQHHHIYCWHIAMNKKWLKRYQKNGQDSFTVKRVWLPAQKGLDLKVPKLPASLSKATHPGLLCSVMYLDLLEVPLNRSTCWMRR